jgi:hypothetical protein
VRTVVRKMPGDTSPDTAAAASHESDFAFECGHALFHRVACWKLQRLVKLLPMCFARSKVGFHPDRRFEIP